MVASADIDSIVERTRGLWREASTSAPGCGVELYAKLAERVRVERGHSSGQSAFRRTAETGVAIRTLTSRGDGAGFAAASGFSRDAVRWVLDRAVGASSRVSGLSPDALGTTPDEVWDLDPLQVLPSRTDLLAALADNPSVTWLELGRTTEVLVGAGGWLAVRRRQRVWGSLQTDSTHLIARRHLGDWREVLDGEATAEVAIETGSGPKTSHSVIFLPNAASPIVLALAGDFYIRGTLVGGRGGVGWTLEDDPREKEGLSGGVFDDAGFTAGIRTLAKNGASSGRIGGPGTMWRRSFRDPPAPSASNLTMPAGTTAIDGRHGQVVDRSRVIRLGPDVWVLELEFVPAQGRTRRRAYVRLSPAELMGCCAARIGIPRVTADGPIVPSLRFDGLRIAFTS
jgi:hypothetical protein